MEKYLHLLAGLPLFENIDPRDIPSMLNCLHAQKGTFSKDSFIRNEGDPADFIGIVLEGIIQVLPPVNQIFCERDRFTSP